MPLFALIVVLIAVPVALLVSPPSDVVKAEGTTGFKITFTFRGEPPLYIPVQISGKNISGSFTKTTPKTSTAVQVDQKGSFRGVLYEDRIVGSLTSSGKAGPSSNGLYCIWDEWTVDDIVLRIDNGRASSGWVDVDAHWRNTGGTSGTITKSLKLTADLTPLIEAGYEFAPAGTTGKTDGDKMVTTTTTKKESDAKSRGAVATITAALTILLAGVASKFVTASDAPASVSASPAFEETRRPPTLADYAETGDMPENLIPVWKNTLSMEKQTMLDEIRMMREGGEIDVSRYEALTADVFNPKVTENEAVLRINVAREYENALRETSPGSAGRPVDTYKAFRETYGVGREELIRMREQARREYWDWKGKEGELREDYEIKDAYHQATRPDRLPDYDPTVILDAAPPEPPEAEFVDADQLSRLARHRLDVANEKMASAETRIRAINARLKFTGKTKGNK